MVEKLRYFIDSGIMEKRENYNGSYNSTNISFHTYKIV